MLNILKIANRNLIRYWRRTLLTTLLITIGIVAVFIFIAASSSFKSLMIGEVTDSMLGHLQIHRKGYVVSLDSLPLNRNLIPKAVKKVTMELEKIEAIESWSHRIKFGGMLSNFTETTSMRINGVVPEKETMTVPRLAARLVHDLADNEPFVTKGKVVIPEVLAKGMKLGVGDSVVIVATNEDGSVNGKNFVVQNVIEGVMGPGSKDGYIHIDDARELLRINNESVSEIVVRLRDLAELDAVNTVLQKTLGEFVNPIGKKPFEIHTWEDLSPFSNMAKMIDLLTLGFKIILIAIVLVSIMNVMVMAVYERIREIGTIAAIGTKPGKILSLFISEGFLLGMIGTLLGTVISLITIYILNIYKITFSFARKDNLLLEPSLQTSDIITICAVVIGVAVIASLQPAWKASRMDPIKALRHV